ncbi:hypothetical protein Bhyg_03377, partial [Pseudolycoriella hygida]
LNLLKVIQQVTFLQLCFGKHEISVGKSTYTNRYIRRMSSSVTSFSKIGRLVGSANGVNSSHNS